MGQSPLDIGAQLGGRSATAGAQAGQSLLYGGLQAAKTMQPANALNPLASGLSGLSQSTLGTAADAYLGKKLGNWWDSLGQYSPQEFQDAQAMMYGGGNAGFGD